MKEREAMDEKGLKRKYSESSNLILSDELRPPKTEKQSRSTATPSTSNHNEAYLLQDEDIHSSSESPESNSNLIKNEPGSSTSVSTSRTSSVEECTSVWTENTLNSFKITSMTSNLVSCVEMLNLVLSSMEPFRFTTVEGELMYQMSGDILNKVDNCLKMLNISNSPLEKLDVHDIEEIQPSHAYQLMFDQNDPQPTGKNKCLLRNLTAWTPLPANFNLTHRFETWFKQMFSVHGHRFTQQLVNICIFKKHHSNYERLFGNLFEEFAGMCGLLCLKQGPDIVATVGSTEVISVADLIFPCFTDSDEEGFSILSLCEIKRGHSLERKNTKRQKLVNPWNDKVVGQHGGELLLSLINMSERKKADKYSIVGMIVQRTNVTITHFTCSDEDLETIKSGRCPKNSSKITYSQPYNYLRKNDRSQLMRVLVALGIIQTIPCKCQ